MFGANAEFIGDLVYRARNVFGNTETTRAEYDRMQEGLDKAEFMVSPKFESLISSTKQEAKMRRLNFIESIWDEPANADERLKDTMYSI
jgi:uncharacterized protein YpuA (DUF1002 family)